MNKMKKALALLLGVIMLGALVLAGCSKTEKPAATSETVAVEASTAQPTPEETKPLEPVELSWYLFGFSPGKDEDLVEEKMGEYLKDKINTTIKIELLDWDSFNTKTAAMSASNESFDIMFNPVWLGFDGNAAKNMFLDITELFPQYMPKTKALLGEDFLKSGFYDGKLYGIPTNKEKAHCYGYLFNKELVDKYGFDINSLTKFTDIEPMLKTIKENEQGVTPLLGSDFIKFLDVYSATGEDVIPVFGRNGETKLFNLVEMPEYLEYALISTDWFNKGYIPKNLPTMKGEEQSALKNSGKVFAYLDNLRPGTDTDVSAGSQGKVTWVQKYMMKKYIGNKDLGGSMNCISRTSKNPERALMFLELLNNDVTLNNMLAFGIENTHYKKVSDNVIEQIPDSGYNHGWQWAFANQFINYIKKGEDTERWKKMDEYNNEAIAEMSLGFKANLESLGTEIAAIKLVQSESYAFAGLKNTEAEVTGIIKRMKDAGIDKVLAEVQKQFDEYLAKQGK